MKIANALIALDSRITTWTTIKNMKYEIEIDEVPSLENKGMVYIYVRITNLTTLTQRAMKSEEYSNDQDFKSRESKLIQIQCVEKNLGYILLQNSFPLDMPVYEKRDDKFVHVGYGRDFTPHIEQKI